MNDIQKSLQELRELSKQEAIKETVKNKEEFKNEVPRKSKQEMDEHKSFSNPNLPRRWSELSYAGEFRVPQGVDPTAGSWPLYYIKRNEKGKFLTLDGTKIDFELQNPNDFNYEAELQVVKDTLDDLNPQQEEIALYWGDGPASKQWTPIIDRLIDTYTPSPARAAHVLAAVQAGINDAVVITWHFKYLYDILRPNQLDQRLKTFICTPKFPTYPASHAAVAGAAEVILSYFFAPQSERLKELAEEAAISRLYGGVHFPSDLSEGLRLGRNIGRIAVNVLKGQFDEYQCRIDNPILINLNPKLPPPPYKQFIPFPDRARACDLPLLP